MKNRRIVVSIICILLIVSAGCVQPGSKPDAKTPQDTGKPNMVVTRQTLSFGDDISQPEKETTIPPAPTPTMRKNITFFGGSSRTITGTNLTGSISNSTTTTNSTTTIIPAPTAILALTVSGITPNSGTQGTMVNITNLAGSNLFNVTSVNLTKSGQPDISATNVTVVSAGQVTCTINLASATSGQWNVMVTNNAGLAGIGTNMFTVM